MYEVHGFTPVLSPFLIRNDNMIRDKFELVRPRLVEIELVFRDGTVSPLQYAVQQNCNVPICRGGPDENEKLLKCLADAEERKCFKICREP